MRTPTPRALAACAALTVLVLTTGCTPSDTEAESTSPAPKVSTSSAEEGQAVADATAALHRFYEVSDQCFSDPQNVDDSCFDSVAVDQVLDDYRTSLSSIRSQGWHFDGRDEVLSVEVVWVNLDASFKQVRLAACVDQSASVLVDASGAPVAPESEQVDRPQRFVWQLVNYDYPAAGLWKVSLSPEEESGSGSC